MIGFDTPRGGAGMDTLHGAATTVGRVLERVGDEQLVVGERHRFVGSPAATEF